jgi:hypothetical protein
MLAMVLAFGMVVVGCGGDDDGFPSALIGVWRCSQSHTITFTSNGYVLIGNISGYKASVSGNTVTVTDYTRGTQSGTFDYSISGREMTITNEAGLFSDYTDMSPWIKQ